MIQAGKTLVGAGMDGSIRSDTGRPTTSIKCLFLAFDGRVYCHTGILVTKFTCFIEAMEAVVLKDGLDCGCLA